MKYYLHDSSSFDDEKITQLYIKFGYEGLGLFYTILEKFAKQEKPIITSVLKHQLKVGKKLEKCWNFMEEIGLIYSNNGESFNEQLLNFSEKYKIKKEKNKKRIKQWRENQTNKNNVTSFDSVSNAGKVKESKVKESKDLKGVEIEFSEGILNPDSTEHIGTEKSVVNGLQIGKIEVFRDEKNPRRIKIGAHEHFRPVSDLLDKEYRHLLETAILTNLKGFSESQIFNAMDEEYPFYEFRDENHFWNSLKGIAKKIKRVSFEKSTPHQMFDANKSAKEKLGIKDE